MEEERKGKSVAVANTSEKDKINKKRRDLYAERKDEINKRRRERRAEKKLALQCCKNGHAEISESSVDKFQQLNSHTTSIQLSSENDYNAKREEINKKRRELYAAKRDEINKRRKERYAENKQLLFSCMQQSPKNVRVLDTALGHKGLQSSLHIVPIYKNPTSKRRNQCTSFQSSPQPIEAESLVLQSTNLEHQLNIENIQPEGQITSDDNKSSYSTYQVSNLKHNNSDVNGALQDSRTLVLPKVPVCNHCGAYYKIKLIPAFNN